MSLIALPRFVMFAFYCGCRPSLQAGRGLRAPDKKRPQSGKGCCGRGASREMKTEGKSFGPRVQARGVLSGIGADQAFGRS